MAPLREIPGFYYDEAKRKYFKIEDSKRTVLPGGAAAWGSEGEVKRRRKEVEREKGEREWKERVRRERVRRVDVGWVLGRETGREGGDGIVKEWAGGLEDRGKIKMWVNLEEGDGGVIDCFYVAGQREAQKEGRKEGEDGWEKEEDEVGEESVWVFAVLHSGGLITTLRNNYINAGDWSPEETGARLVLGTQRGVYCARGPGATAATTEMDTRRRPAKLVPPFRGDVLAVDFLHAQPQVVLAGTRSGHVCQLDTRTAPEAWDSMVFRHKSSVAHLRAVGGFDVLAAGPKNAMCIYDLRFVKAKEQKAGEKPFEPWERNTAAPAVEFPGYRNEAHIKIGLDVLTQPGYGHGVVAAAHDDCTVGLYSLRDGSRMPSGDVDKSKAPGVVKAIQFQTVASDQHPSLFVGVGSVIQKFSY
ncbi:hypothetical protein QC763_306810 [Podospora pseudopauciseta]|nr:hypothetical protein QC763_306810 [Podospora pseudopauciseta]